MQLQMDLKLKEFLEKHLK